MSSDLALIHNWNAQQSAALSAVNTWFCDPSAPRLYRLFGYAGTGKTTLARHLAEHVHGLVLFAAFTGKAAAVLRERGCDGATTLHSLLYHVASHDKTELFRLEALVENMDVGDPDYREALAMYEAEQRRVRGPRFQLNPDSILSTASLLVIDECSMVNSAMGRDILSFNKKVLILGDPAQLPPVEGGGFFTNATPDTLLTEIHRQAADNPIIRWATMVRNGEVVPYGDEGLAKKFRREKVSEAWLAKEAGQLLCGKNDTRFKLNAIVRKTLGHEGPFPHSGERLVCLKNNHKLGLLNGEIWIAKGKPIPIDPEWPKELTQWVKHETNEVVTKLIMDTEIFLGKPPASRSVEHFDYGYALTVHKSQGSQWPTVTVYDDGFAKRSPSERQRWLYTAITRAQHQLHIVTS